MCRSEIGWGQIARWQTSQGNDAKPRKGRYDGKRARVDTRVIYTKAVQETADGKEYSEQLILRNVKQLILFQN